MWLAQSKTGLDVAIPDYMATRRQSIGSYCLFVVVEYVLTFRERGENSRGLLLTQNRWAHGIKLTQDIMDHPSIATCERAAADLTWL